MHSWNAETGRFCAGAETFTLIYKQAMLGRGQFPQPARHLGDSDAQIEPGSTLFGAIFAGFGLSETIRYPL
jgi:hypothetical protein